MAVTEREKAREQLKNLLSQGVLEEIDAESSQDTPEVQDLPAPDPHEATRKLLDYTFWRAADIEAYGVSTTTDTHLVSAQSVATINSKHNSVQAYPETLNVVVTGGPVAVSLWQTVAIASPSWVAGDGSLEISTAGTLTLTAAKKLLTFFVDVGCKTIDLRPYFEVNDEGIHLLADGTKEVWSLTATRLTGSATTVGVNMSYRELW